MIIKIKAKSGDCNIQNVNLIDGIDDDSNFVEYMDTKRVSIKDKLEDGYMDFTVEDGVIYTNTEYRVKPEHSNDEFNQKELLELIDYTQGQWSDGIGEGFEQFPIGDEDGEEIYLSPWYHGQKATAELIRG